MHTYITCLQYIQKYAHAHSKQIYIYSNAFKSIGLSVDKVFRTRLLEVLHFSLYVRLMLNCLGFYMCNCPSPRAVIAVVMTLICSLHCNVFRFYCNHNCITNQTFVKLYSAIQRGPQPKSVLSLTN